MNNLKGGYKFEEKLRLWVCKQKRLNTTVLEIVKLMLFSRLPIFKYALRIQWEMKLQQLMASVQHHLNIMSNSLEKYSCSERVILKSSAVSEWTTV
jgi:hypothetical protein